MNKKNEAINDAVLQLTERYAKESLFSSGQGKCLPNRSIIVDIIQDLRHILFPRYFGPDSGSSEFPEHFIGHQLNDIYDRLREQIQVAFLYQNGELGEERADEVTARFIRKLPEIQELLLKDVQAGFDGDPAAKSKEEIIFSYPGFYAIYIYRLAHVLYLEEVPFIPRIMTAYGHGATGIDINPGATIGEYFFIDHGTGVVIGETTEIGNYVKLYQGVTLGALSTRKGQELSGVKRHPTIGDRVTIYSNSTVLGGETVIGENTIVGGNTFITESISADTKVSAKNPELVIKAPRSKEEEMNVWYWEI